MRLLHSTMLELQDFPNHEGISYAILSHVWAEEKVQFQEIDGFNAATTPQRVKEKLGYKKIEACCEQAKGDGFDFVWIDTCCIDKRSSAELSEAINSMYRWYKDCTVCYAYLADVPSHATPTLQDEKFRKSKWFTRGWTLQELIAPVSLEFYGDQWYSDRQGASLGTRRSLRAKISVITYIPEDCLLGPGQMSKNYSIAQKMSWAANRATTRVEDRAYSLLGLFNVNMPLLYGEGNRAFVRLQEEIMRFSTDETLFAWKDSMASQHGLLAPSPSCFVTSGRIVEKIWIKRNSLSTTTNKGLQLEIMLSRASDLNEIVSYDHNLPDPLNEDEISSRNIGWLNCMDEQSGRTVGILLKNLNHYQNLNDNETQFVRVDPNRLSFIDPHLYGFPHEDRRTIFARIANVYHPEKARSDADFRQIQLERRHSKMLVMTTPFGFEIVDTMPRVCWEKDEYTWIGRRHNGQFNLPGYPFLYALLFDNKCECFALYLCFFIGEPCIQLKSREGREFEEDVGIVRSFTDKQTDRATLTLDSGGVVSASVRSERSGGSSFYALHIFIDDHSRPASEVIRHV